MLIGQLLEVEARAVYTSAGMKARWVATEHKTLDYTKSVGLLEFSFMKFIQKSLLGGALNKKNKIKKDVYETLTSSSCSWVCV